MNNINTSPNTGSQVDWNQVYQDACKKKKGSTKPVKVKSAPKPRGSTVIDLLTFDRINRRIREAIQHYSPSGSSGRVNAWVSAVKSIFKDENINEEAYWQSILDRKKKTPVINKDSEKPEDDLNFNPFEEASK